MAVTELIQLLLLS